MTCDIFLTYLEMSIDMKLSTTRLYCFWLCS